MEDDGGEYTWTEHAFGQDVIVGNLYQRPCTHHSKVFKHALTRGG